MKIKMTLTITIIIVTTIIAFSYLFFNKTYIDFEQVCILNKDSTEYYPDAYRFFHTSEELTDFFNMNSNTRELKKQLPSELKFDFDKYSYCIVYGNKVEKMFYSIKTTMFNDISPSYSSCRRYGKKCVFIKYKNNAKVGNTYIYKINHNPKLRGFDGL